MVNSSKSCEVFINFAFLTFLPFASGRCQYRCQYRCQCCCTVLGA